MGDKQQAAVLGADVAALKETILANFHHPDQWHSTWWINTNEMGAAVLDALPALLREDSPAGAALRARLGLRWEIEYAGMYGPPRSRHLQGDREPLS